MAAQRCQDRQALAWLSNPLAACHPATSCFFCLLSLQQATEVPAASGIAINLEEGH